MGPSNPLTVTVTVRHDGAADQAVTRYSFAPTVDGRASTNVVGTGRSSASATHGPPPIRRSRTACVIGASPGSGASASRCSATVPVHRSYSPTRVGSAGAGKSTTASRDTHCDHNPAADCARTSTRYQCPSSIKYANVTAESVPTPDRDSTITFGTFGSDPNAPSSRASHRA